MAQSFFLDPIVSVNPATTGVGDGTATVDRLTHFTITQDYTLTCIAKTPDTLFAVTGSLDGPVGIATVGIQFYDLDLKVFLTITQGSTPFEVGDIITFSVEHGTDLNQDNIDDYDEYPQKNFGLGVKGSDSGDHNIRYSNTSLNAYRYIQDMKFTAVTAGAAGNNVSVELLDPVPDVKATLTVQDLTYTSVLDGTLGNAITIEYAQFSPAVTAYLEEQDLRFEADTAGAAGNSITIEFTAGALAGFEMVSVLGNAITVQIEDGVSTATQIKTALDGDLSAAALIDVFIIGLGANPQTIFGPSNLANGADPFGEAGFEEVQVVGTDILVTLESGVSTANQVKAAIEASAPASALVTVAVSGTGTNPQTAPEAQQSLTGGVDSYGFYGDETIDVTGNDIKIYMESGKSTAQLIKTAFDAFGAATALASLSIIGSLAANPQYGPYPARNLIGGKNKSFALNHDELTDSGDFVEGNANLNLRDMFAIGQSIFDGHVRIQDALNLDDQIADNYSGLPVANAQKIINELIQNDKIALRTNDNGKLSWAIPTLSFGEDIFIEFPDTGVTNTILASESPITLNDGESVYVILNRREDVNLTPVVSAIVPKSVDALRLATRFGSSVVLYDNTLIKDGNSAAIGEGGSGGAVSSVDFYDPISGSLPSGAGVTIDGIAGVNGDIVLFGFNNRVYELGGVGTSITWTPVNLFSGGLDATDGELVIIKKGNGFNHQMAMFDGTEFKINETVRYFNGADYWEISSLYTADITDNTTDNVFTVAYAGSENLIVDFSIIRGSSKETGTLHITTDGTNVAATTTGSNIGISGVTFSADISGSDLRLRYTASNSGTSGTMKYFVRRWSDIDGGPAGPPSYSTGGGGSGAAAGPANSIQYNAAGLLAGDSDFTWDDVNNVLTIGSYQHAGLQTAVLLDNSSNVTTFSYDKTLYPNVIIKFSMLRDGKRRMGRMMILNDGTIASYSDDSVFTDDVGVTLSAVVNGSNIDVQYTTTSTGFNASFKYAIERWS